MNQVFEDFIKNFKPEFGNQNHINALEMITKLRKKEHLVSQLKVSQVAIKKGLKEIKYIEESIIGLITKI